MECDRIPDEEPDGLEAAFASGQPEDAQEGPRRRPRGPRARASHAARWLRTGAGRGSNGADRLGSGEGRELADPWEADAPPESLSEYATWALERAGESGMFQRAHNCVLVSTWVLCGLETMATIFTVMPAPRRALCAARDPNCSSEVLAHGDCSASYEFVDVGLSVVAEFDLVCERAMHVPLLGTVFFLGFLFGVSLLGRYADSRGRRAAYLGSLVILQIGALAAVAAPVLPMYAAARLLTGFGVGGFGLVAFVWNSEMISSSWRSSMIYSTNICFATGIIVLCPLAYIVPHWRALSGTLFVIGFLFFAPFPFMAESPKWLASKQRAQELHDVICRAAAVNGRQPPPAPRRPSPRRGDGAEGTPAAAERDEALPKRGDAGQGRSVLRQLLLDVRLSRRFYIMCVAWFALSLGYYGLTMNASSVGGSSIYWSTALSAVVEIPAYIVAFWVVDHPRTGRRGSTSFGLLCGGLCCVVSALVQGDSHAGLGGVAVFLAYLGKSAVALSFAVVYLYAAELFPTDVRSQSLGLQSLCARLGGMMAPQVVVLGDVSKSLPLVIFGAPCLLAGLLMLGLPETRGQALLDTIEDVAALGPPRCLPWPRTYRALGE